MGKVILLCGKLCSGKSTYARALREKSPSTVILSCDALMLTLFPQGAGEHHDTLSERAREYLFMLSLDILATGADVILDWGFWTKQWRQKARAFYEKHSIPCSLHYIDVAPDIWQRHILSRNEEVLQGATDLYAVDEGLLNKVNTLFVPPEPDEIDVRYHPD